MKKNAWLARLLTVSLSLSPLYAQQQGSAPRTSPASPASLAAEEDVLRITTNLVQLDAVVTDKEGRVVSDLRAEDFEVLEDGRPQAITNLSFIPLEAPPTASAAATPGDAPRAASTKGRNALPVPAPPRPAHTSCKSSSTTRPPTRNARLRRSGSISKWCGSEA